MSRWRIPVLVAASCAVALNASAQLAPKVVGDTTAKSFVRYSAARDEVATPKCSSFDIRTLSVTIPDNGVLVVQGHVTLSGMGRSGGGCGNASPALPGFANRNDIKAGRVILSLDQTAPGAKTALSQDAVELDADIFRGGAERLSVSSIIQVTRGQTVQLTMSGYNSTTFHFMERSLSAMYFPGDSPNQPNQPALSAPPTVEDPVCDAVCVGRVGGVPNGWALPAPMDGVLKYVDQWQGACEQKRGQNEAGTGVCKANTVCRSGFSRFQDGGVWKCKR